MPNTINAGIQQLIRDLKANGLWGALAQEFYGEGTYTPEYYGGTTAGAATWSANYPTGWWVRVGALVHVWGSLAWTAHSGTGEGRISLPFVHVNPGPLRDIPVLLRISSTGITNTVPQGLCRAGQSYWRLESVTGSGAAAVQNVLSAGNIAFALSYQTE